MKYRHIVSVTGMSGLYHLLSTKNNGAFVKSLEDLSNKFISSRTHQVTPLESIEIYTTGENVYLHDVLESIKNVDAEVVDLDFKNNDAVSAVFAKALPNYDKKRVYLSDIKKVLKWYLLLKKNDLLDFSEYRMPVDADTTNSETPAEEVVTEEKPAKKTSTKKTKVAKEEVEGAEEKPAKKTTTKKAAKKKDEE